MNKNCSVVVLHEDEPTREQAIRCLNDLVESAWRHFEFSTDWASLEDLRDQAIACGVAEKASKADFVIFSLRSDGEFPFETLEWIERWLQSREESHEGALVGLFLDHGDSCQQKEIFLRNLARKTGLDFLTRLPEGSMGNIPDSLNSFNERATCMTGVLDEILQNPPPPSPQFDTAIFSRQVP